MHRNAHVAAVTGMLYVRFARNNNHGYHGFIITCRQFKDRLLHRQQSKIYWLFSTENELRSQPTHRYWHFALDQSRASLQPFVYV